MVNTDPGSPSQPAPLGTPAAGQPGQGGSGLADFDHGPISDALENHLQDWLNRPVQDILNQFHMGQLPNVGASDLFPSVAGAVSPNQLTSGLGGMGGGNNMIGGLLKPATDLLGTVGNGVFQGLNPSQLFGGITQAFQQAAGGLQQALGSMMSGGQGWAGSGATGAANAATQTLAHGAATAAQGGALAGHYTTAAADSSQGYGRILEAIQQGQDELSALAGGLPWTAANMVESASRTTARVTAIVTELESTLTGEAGATAATGAPVEAATQGPQAATSMLSPLLSVGMSMLGPAMSVGTMPLSLGMGAVMSGAQAGLQAGTSLASQVGKAGAGGVPAIPAGAGTHLVSAAKGGGVGGGAGGGGGGGAATTPARAMAASPMIQRESTAAAVTSSAVTRAAAGTAGAGMGGGGMMGSGAAGAHGSKAGASNHNTASFLHTTDQGDELVGDLGTASPPVIGESDPNADPDVQLRV